VSEAGGERSHRRKRPKYAVLEKTREVFLSASGPDMKAGAETSKKKNEKGSLSMIRLSSQIGTSARSSNYILRGEVLHSEKRPRVFHGGGRSHQPEKGRVIEETVTIMG